MKPKTVIRAILIAFVVWSIVTLIAKEAPRSPEESQEQPQQTLTSNALDERPAGASDDLSPATDETDSVPESEDATETSTEPPPHRVMVYYFHGHARCYSCIRIETLTDEAVHAYFSDQLENGSLEWRVVNIEESGNEHFTRDYELYTKSVIVADFRDGEQVRWKNLDRVWELLRNDNAFHEYIRDEVDLYLSGD